jgi:predicted metal-dependent enzyme (double-stranded beta helix superfamily)
MASNPIHPQEAYSIEAFATDVEAVVARETEQAKIIPQLEPLLARFLTSDLLPEQFCHAAPGRVASDHQDFTLYRLHHGTDNRFNIMAAIWPAGVGTGIHDHAGNWVVEGVYRNKLQTIRYTRQDDESRPGYAELRETMTLEMLPGDVAHVQYPDQFIHDFINPTQKPTVSVHIYGGDITQETLNYFDLANKAVAPVAHDLSYDNE